jgi:hypothetical protein
MRGVAFNKQTGKWRVSCAQKYIGEFASEEIAINERKKAEIEKYGAAFDDCEIKIDGDIAFVPLWTRGGKVCAVSKIDAQSVPLVSSSRWCVVNSGYAVARVGREYVYMHRVIFNDASSEVVDHINGDRLDNRLANLRPCTQFQNSKNLCIKKNNSSGHAGISKAPKGRWRARIMHERKEYFLGIFDSLEDAVAARQKADAELNASFVRVVTVTAT